MTIPTGAQLELLIIAHMHPEGATWPPPDRLRHLVDPLIAAGLLLRENDCVRLSSDGEGAIARDERAAAIREELVAMQAADQSAKLRSSRPTPMSLAGAERRLLTHSRRWERPLVGGQLAPAPIDRS